ncbi:PRC-barrel domain-containing protein [Methanotorris formicicus]|uniref:PRC-barrel domain protein n=1 Tax=Methanotorris formicicus Mc-S-70 TaxID=647171 RepID=H1L1R1_9EURY|nr:PRC-barrel domain-containing protein [Methanotorris formicicus]EHP83370.1 PRC-barrel domain protein [Methanotorris formicicus Mc-S-70]
MAIKISDILGKQIYTMTARYVGKVYDAILDTEKSAISGIVVSDVSNGCLKELVGNVDKKIVLPYNLVTAIGNIVLMKPPAKVLVKTSETEKSKISK